MTSSSPMRRGRRAARCWENRGHPMMVPSCSQPRTLVTGLLADFQALQQAPTNLCATVGFQSCRSPAWPPALQVEPSADCVTGSSPPISPAVIATRAGWPVPGRLRRGRAQSTAGCCVIFPSRRTGTPRAFRPGVQLSGHEVPETGLLPGGTCEALTGWKS